MVISVLPSIILVLAAMSLYRPVAASTINTASHSVPKLKPPSIRKIPTVLKTKVGVVKVGVAKNAGNRTKVGVKTTNKNSFNTKTVVKRTGLDRTISATVESGPLINNDHVYVSHSQLTEVNQGSVINNVNNVNAKLGN